MTIEEAKQILACRRPSGADDEDPLIQEALAMAQSTPELASWAAAEVEFDRAIGERVRAVPPPPGLHASLLKRYPALGMVIKFPPAATWLAAAACLAVVVWSLASAFRPAPGLNTLRRDLAARLSSGDYQLAATGSLAELTRYVERHQGPGGLEVPANLSASPTHGCQVFDWRGNQVAMICFDGGEMGVVHLFVLDRESLPDPPPEAEPIDANIAGWATSSWSTGGKTYVAMARAEIPRLRSLL